jgi:DNA-binding MarR family transcriptional regulator
VTDSPPPAATDRSGVSTDRLELPCPPETLVAAVRAGARLARMLERASGDLGLPHYRVLSAIADGEGRASRVAERLALGRPTVSAAVDALCRQGLLERNEAAGDQRAIDLRVTAAGTARLEEVESRLVRTLGDLCGRIPEGTALLEGLAALGPALDGAAGERLAGTRVSR